MMPARLIVNSDDFGLTEGVNRAVAELHRAGALLSATLMASGHAFSSAISVAKADPALGVGCHLVFLDGSPLSEPELIPSLVRGRSFHISFSGFMRDALLGSIAEDDLVREGVAQVARLQAAGVAVTHLDTHKHTHILPVVARAVLRIAEQSGVQAIRNPFEPAWGMALGHGSIQRRASVKLLHSTFRASFTRLLQTRPAIKTTDGTIGVAATGAMTVGALNDLLAAMPPHGTWELMVHPGYDDADLAATRTRLRSSREIERRALASTLVSTAGRDLPQLIHFGNL